MNASSPRPSVSCDLCGLVLPWGARKQLKAHAGNRFCRADAMARHLIAQGLRPYPTGHSLPSFVPIVEAMTRTALQGEPRVPRTRDQKDGAGNGPGREPERQCWAPRAVRHVTDAYAGMDKQDERDALLKGLLDARPAPGVPSQMEHAIAALVDRQFEFGTYGTAAGRVELWDYLTSLRRFWS